MKLTGYLGPEPDPEKPAVDDYGLSDDEIIAREFAAQGLVWHERPSAEPFEARPLPEPEAEMTLEERRKLFEEEKKRKRYNRDVEAIILRVTQKAKRDGEALKESIRNTLVLEKERIDREIETEGKHAAQRFGEEVRKLTEDFDQRFEALESALRKEIIEGLTYHRDRFDKLVAKEVARQIEARARP
ncbi:hypothetical protein [Ensifer sp. 2TAB8]